MKRRMAILWVCCLLGLGANWSMAAQSVVVSILPQKFFMERIGGDLVEVAVMVKPGASPATYEPTPGQMAGLSGATGYFAIGVPFEAVWLDRIRSTNPDMAVVHVDAGIDKIPMAAHSHRHEGEDHDDHDMGEEHEGREHAEEHEHEDHEQGILDPHVWLAPDTVRIVAVNTCQGLIALDPDNTAVYEANLAVFLKEIDELDGQISSILAGIPEDKRIFMVFHPSWGYFANEYGLTQVAIESEGKEPGPRELAEIVAHGKENGISVVFVQPQFSDKSARVIASEMDAQVLPLDPLAEDWADNLLKAAGAFAKALK